MARSLQAQQRELLFTAVDASDQIVMITGADQRIVYVNGAFTRVTGYNHQAEKVFLYRGEPRTATYTAHVPPETRACMYWLRNRRPEDWREISERAAAELAQEAAADAALRVELDQAEERVRRWRAERETASDA